MSCARHRWNAHAADVQISRERFEELSEEQKEARARNSVPLAIGDCPAT